MWKAAVIVMQALLAVGFCALSYGPCRDVNTVNLDTNQWPGICYVNVMTHNVGARCLWVEKSLKYADGNSANTTAENVLIAEVFRHMDNRTRIESTFSANYVDEGHYRITQQLASGNTLVYEAYWLYFDLPQLDCHYVCSDDEMYKNGHGAFWCESTSADALADNACKIKEIVESNGFSIEDLMVVDNCDCPNIPHAYESSCVTPSISDYFSNC